MSSPSPTPAVDVSLHEAGCYLVAVAEGHAAALHAALAVLAILNAAKQPDRCQASAQLIAAIDSAMDVVMPIVAADVADEMTEQDVAFGLGSACSLLHFLDQAEDEIANPGRRGPEIQDRFDYAALIASELHAIHLRRRIQSRGDWRRKDVWLNACLASKPDDDTVLH